MADEWWTTEQVAEYLGITVTQVYESSRRGEFPGNIGKQRGRRKLYLRSLVEAGPTEPDTTNDPTTALLWALGGIHTTLRAIHAELVSQRPQYFDLTVEETIEIEDEE